jgi:glucose/mannose-6-phosphate isomerase
VRGYELPAYADEKTLVIGSSFSGNTEETLSAIENAKMRGCQIAIVAAGGKLVDMARAELHPMVALPSEVEARMAVLHNLRALAKLLESFGLAQQACDELAANAEWLKEEVDSWKAEVPAADNYAKQLANGAVGKIAMIYGGALTAPVAYKWKMAFNENAKNLAFWNQLPEFNHNEFIGWTSHPVDKPFAVFDLVSNFEHKQILRRFEVSDRLLSGSRPKSQTVKLRGENLIGQLAWASILADFVSVYLAILNGVDPTSIERVDKLKKELSS